MFQMYDTSRRRFRPAGAPLLFAPAKRSGKRKAGQRGTRHCVPLCNPPISSKREVPTCAAAHCSCLVLPRSVLLPGRDDVRGVLSSFAVYRRSSASEAGARTAMRKGLIIPALFAPACWVFPKRGAKASLFGSFFFHIFCRRGVKKICRWHIFSLRPQQLCCEEGTAYRKYGRRRCGETCPPKRGTEKNYSSTPTTAMCSSSSCFCST